MVMTCLDDHEGHHGHDDHNGHGYCGSQDKVNGCSGSDVRADLAVVVLILLVPEDNEEGHPGHSLSGGHDHLKGELHFISVWSWQP